MLLSRKPRAAKQVGEVREMCTSIRRDSDGHRGSRRLETSGIDPEGEVNESRLGVRSRSG